MEVVSSEPAHIEDSVVSTISTSIDTSASQISALCDEIEQIADHIVKKRKSESNRDSRSFSAHYNILQTATGTFVRLRLLNRKLHEDKAALAQNVNDMKQLTDDLSLLLENKAREVAYIQKEIDSTEKLETIYQTINIIPLDSFLEEAPDEYKQSTNTPHEMMLSRLRYEIKQREMLMAAKSEAKAKRDELRKIKRRRIDKLEKIDGRLQTYLKSLELLGRSIGATEGAEEEGDDSMNQESKHGAKASAEDADEPVKEPKRIREIRGGGTPLRVGTPRM